MGSRISDRPRFFSGCLSTTTAANANTTTATKTVAKKPEVKPPVIDSPYSMAYQSAINGEEDGLRKQLDEIKTIQLQECVPPHGHTQLRPRLQHVPPNHATAVPLGHAVCRASSS